MTAKKGRYYQVNRNPVLSMRCIGKGCTSARKNLNIMNRHAPFHHTSWKQHAEGILESVTKLLENNLAEEAMNPKCHMVSTGEVKEMNDEKL